MIILCETSAVDATSSILALVGVLLGAGIAGIATWRAASIAATTAFEGEKYKQRLASYQALWSTTQALRRNPEPQDLNSRTMQETIDSLDEWYFRTGGLLLTDEARRSYFGLIDAMNAAVTLDSGHLSDLEYAPIFAAATELRNITATEVRGTSKTSFQDARSAVDTTGRLGRTI